MAGGTIRPFSLFVVKLHSRCNIACTYCYVYEHADQSWRDQPTTMDDATVDALARRIGEHAATHKLPVVRVVLHGGEPLMAGPRTIRRTADALRRALPEETTLDLRMQTNGVLLADNEGLCDVLRAADITVSVSLDGSRAANDRHRLYRDGRSSYDQAVRGIRRLGAPRNRAIFAGLLCTIDTDNDPIETYEALAELDPPRVDFLLPHGNWDNRPPLSDTESTPYADWLLTIHDRWVRDGRRLPIRVFDSIRSVLAGGGSLTEALGTDAAGFVVVETNGAIEQADSLKTAYHGAPVTGFSVFTDSFDDAAHHPGFLRGGAGIAELSASCRRCPVVEVCGGGLYAHRYRSENGFDNPSVHCADLFKLITHVAAANTDAEDRGTAGAQPGETVHQMPEEYFDTLASGYGGTAELGFLMDARDSINRIRIAEILDVARSRGAYSNRLLDLVEDVDRAAPEGFRQILAHPYIRVWAKRCLQRLDAKVSEPEDLEYLAAIAVAAAARGGVALEAVLTVRAGTVYLPTLGSFTFDGAPPSELLVRTVADRLPGPDSNPGDRIVADAAAGARWNPVRTLRSDASAVALEDSDPDRDCHRWPVADRLAPSEVARWQQTYREAWHIIEADHPEHAPGLSAGLSTIVPLAPRPGTRVSSTAREAVGAVAIALPPTADDLALLLIHEIQHVKLGAVMDLFDLHDPDDPTRYRPPWRDDERPLEGYLQGVYAHAAVADVWRSRWLRHQALGIAGSVPVDAGAEYAYWRRQIVIAVDTLSAAPGLTDLGRRFFGLLGERVAGWLDDPLPAAVRQRARGLAEQRPGSG